MYLTANPWMVRFKSAAYTLPEFMLIVSVFSKELGSENIFGIDFDFISYPFYIIFFITNLARILLSQKPPFRLFIYVIISSAVSIFALNMELGGFVKQILPIIIIFTTVFYIVEKENIVKLFHLYTLIAYYSAIFGIIQYFLSLGGISFLIKIRGKLDSIAYEPSHYAAILVPALVFSLFHFKQYKRQFFVMLTALVFTFNVTGYVVFLLILCVAFINPIYFLFAIPVVYYVIFNYLPTINPYFSLRFFDTMDVLAGKKDILKSRLEVNGTTLSFFSNWETAVYALKENPVTGCGLGGHEEMYFRRFENTAFRYNYYYGLNAKSGHSLTIRILSEFGILGFVMYCFVLVKSVLFFNNTTHRAIALACLTHFLCKTLKLGGYIDYGTPFFFSILLLNAFYFQHRSK